MMPPLRVCRLCEEPLTPNSAVYDGYGTPRWRCTNPDCPEHKPWHDDFDEMEHRHP